jgi:hypothetical protein
MFTPSELEQMPIELERRMLELQQRTMEDIVRRIRINDEITRSADWQIFRLVQMGQSTEYIQKQIQQALKLSDEEISNLYEGAIQSGYTRDEKIYTAVGKDFIPFKENAELQQLIQSVITQTKEQMINITRTLGFTIEMGGKTVFTPLSEYLQRALDTAVVGITDGTFDYNSTLKKIVQEMTKSGLRTVDYSTGWSNRVEVAARRALMSGVTQVTSHINERNADELGTDKFEVSWHSTARPEHQVWQGRVYTRKELRDICGLGTGPGLMGWNCYHSYYPFIDGISERQYTDEQLEDMNAQENKPREFNGKEYNAYEATQRQRQLETLMRTQRQKIKLLENGGAIQEEIIFAKAKYQGTMQQYKMFSEKMGLPQQKERIYMDGLGRMVSGKIAMVVKQRDIGIHKSVGAAAKNYRVRLPNGTYSKLVEGTEITKVFTFAGKGTNRKIDVAEFLEKQYNVPAGEWKKTRGDGFVIDEKGNNRHAELHWFESDKTDRIKMKAKRYFDEG